MSNSIRVDLLKWLIAPLLVINLVGALLVYILAWSPAQAAMDQNLAEMAFDLRMHLRPEEGSIGFDLPLQSERILRSNEADLTFFVVRDGRRTLAGDKDFPQLLVPGKEDDPFSYSGKLRDTPVRILVLKTMVGAEQVMIGVAETLTRRREIQSSILLTVLGLEAVLVLTSVAIAWFAVTEGLFPLQQMQRELDARAPNDLSAVNGRQPLELQPLARAINGLLQRVENDGRSRQTFLSNVAHQLRTPLAGLQAQLTLLQARHANDRDTAHAVDLMTDATQRMIRQTNQLLALARAEPTQGEMRRMETMDLDALVEEVIDQFVHAAVKKNIDIGFDLKPARIVGDYFLLRDLIDNLVDNALRYTQEGGAVTLRCGQRDNAVIFEVEDNGAGIPVPERGKIFNRFYRLDTKLPGSGLGLAIVGDIAKAHDATVTLASGSGGVGTLFSVSFPLPPLEKT